MRAKGEKEGRGEGGWAKGVRGSPFFSVETLTSFRLESLF